MAGTARRDWMIPRSRWSRREFLASLGAAATAACLDVDSGPGTGSARLSARPGTPSLTITPGTWPLTLRGGKDDGRLLVPAGYQAGTPMPFVLALHGATGRATGPTEFLRTYAESRGFIVLAVNSEGQTWDALLGSGYGFDVQLINAALQYAFARCSVDAGRLVVQGFSDGASYALGLGYYNGDLFTRVVAHSPGGIVESANNPVGRSEYFITHGTSDPVLPISSTSRVVVPLLRGEGYTVDYHEFDGGHTIPTEMASLAADWIVH